MSVSSKSNIHRLILGLEERGHIARIPQRARCIEILFRHDTLADQPRLTPNERRLIDEFRARPEVFRTVCNQLFPNQPSGP